MRCFLSLFASLLTPENTERCKNSLFPDIYANWRRTRRVRPHCVRHHPVAFNSGFLGTFPEVLHLPRLTPRSSSAAISCAPISPFRPRVARRRLCASVLVALLAGGTVPTEGEVYAKLYRPGDAVDRSGIYRVSHDRQHTEDHEVTVISGRRFPPCRSCGDHPRYKPCVLPCTWSATNTSAEQGVSRVEINDRFGEVRRRASAS